MSINVDKWYDNNKKAVYHYMRNKYPSDITRDQFGIVKPFLESATKATRPYTYDLYDIFCAILYVLREGCRWRAFPHDFPKWEVVYCHYRKWGKKNYTGHDERSAFEKALEELAMPERIATIADFTDRDRAIESWL